MTFNYQVGGSLPADAPSYVERQCDRDYYELLKERKYCYVFNCRQMGKSSLRVRVTHKLQAEGIVCATIDPQKIGVEVTCEQWYASAIRSLVGDLDLKNKFDLRSWIRERELLSPVQRFAEFIETVVLQEIDAPIVIFVEEIDRLLSLKFGMDDFFGLVRSFFEDRPTKPDYNRLTFSFLGVATPTDLIQSHNTSAFNIGYAVEMAGFTLAEALPLMQGLASKVANPQDYLAEAVKWTGGQPFLIQRLLGMMEKELVGIATPENIAGWVENLVQERIVTNWESQDAPPHLTTIRDRVLSVEEKLRGRMLGCYQQVLADGALEDDRSEERSRLRLTGLVVRRDGRLISYNPIYGAVFNNTWVEGQLADLRPEFYGSAFRAWQDAEEGQNQGFLLRGQALEEAEVWARGKRLSDVDEQFLQESRKFEKQEIIEAHQILQDAEQKANQRLKRSVKFGILMIFTSVSIVTATFFYVRNKTIDVQILEKQKIELEVQKFTLLQNIEDTEAERAKAKLEVLESDINAKLIDLQERFNNSEISEKKNFETQILLAQARLEAINARNQLLNYQELDSLLIAIKAGHKLKNIISSNEVQGSIKTEISIALQSIVYKIREIQAFKGHSDSVSSVVFSPDGKTIATSSWDNTVKLWNLEGKELQTFKGHSNSVLNVVFSPDGKTIATSSRDSTVKLWNLEGKELQTFKGHEGWVITKVVFSPDGKTIATSSLDSTAKLWNLEGKELQTFKGHSDWVLSIAFSPDGKTLATGSGDKTVKLWNLEGKELQTFKGHSNIVNSVTFSPDGKTLATGSNDKIVKLWNLEGKELQTFKGHSDSIWSVAFSPDGKTIATGSGDKAIKLWNLEGKEIQNFKGYSFFVNSVNFSPDGKTIVSGGDNTVKLWNLEGKELQTFKHSDSVSSLAFSPDGKTIATANWDKTVKLWNLEGKEIQTFKGHSDSVRSVAFSPDGKTIASGSDENVKLWNLEGKEIQNFKGHGDSISSLTFSPDGKTIATASRDKTVKLWNLEGKEIQTFKGHSASVYSVAFSPDGKTIATSGYDKTVKLWNLEGKEIQTFKGHSDSVSGLAFSPDGKTVATASWDNTIKLWNLEGKEIQTFKGHNFIVWSVAFSPDGKTLASGSGDKTVKLWNLEGKELQTFKEHSDRVFSVAFSPDGKTLASASRDNTVKLWNLDFDDLMAKGCAWLHDYLVNNPNASDEERQMCGIASRQK
jgi:WD40 repeat protein